MAIEQSAHAYYPSSAHPSLHLMRTSSPLLRFHPRAFCSRFSPLAQGFVHCSHCSSSAAHREPLQCARETLFQRPFAHCERVVKQLKKTQFSLHGLHSVVSLFDREKASESFTVNAVPEKADFPDDWVQKNVTRHENPRSELHNPLLTKENMAGHDSAPIRASTATTDCDGVAGSSPINGLEIPMNYDALAGSSPINGRKSSAQIPMDKPVDPFANIALTSGALRGQIHQNDSKLQEHVIDMTPALQCDGPFLDAPDEPLLLMRGMELPQRWNAPGGTVVLIDKPAGWTSFSVCEKIRKLVKVKKVGHAGTLDPMSTGLLIICVGQATKLADSYQALFKVYTGTLRIGEATSSGDAESPVNEEKPWEHITDEDIQKAKEAFVGEIMQIPPMFSAIKVQGERLYAKARRGEHLDIPARKVTVHEFQIERSKQNRQDLNFRVCCSKGTYIRSLCTDLGKALDSCAHMTKLRREQIGDLCASDAWGYFELVNIYRQLYGKPQPQPQL